MSIIEKLRAHSKSHILITKATPCRFLVLLVLVLCFSAIAGIASDPVILKKITVVSDDNYPPFIFRDKNNQLQGILVDEWRLWEKKTGIKVDLRGMDWDKAKKTMAEGNAQVIDTIFFTEERAKTLAFSAPYASLDVPIFFHRNISGIKDAQSLHGFTIGVKAGDACIDYFKKRGIHTLREYPNYESIVRDAADQKIKVFCIDAPPAQYYLYKMNLEQQYRHTAPLYTGQFHRAVPKEREDLRKTVEEGFAKISVKEREEIEKRWFGSSIAPPRHWTYLFYLMGVFLILGALLMLWNHTLRRRVAQKTVQLQEAINNLEKSEELFRSYLEYAPDGITMSDLEGNFIYINRKCEEISGYQREELIGKNFVKLNILSEYDRNKTVRSFQANMENKATITDKYELINKDGRLIPVEINTTVVQRMGKRIALAFVRDITERKQAEEEKLELERRLQHAKKLEAVGQLAGGVAHDLNNILGALTGYSELLLMEIPEGHGSRGHVEKILQSTEKGAAIIQDLLTLARRGVMVSDVINLNHIVSGFIKTPVFEKIMDYHPHVTFRTECDEHLRNIKGSSVHLEKTLMNLVSNAAESIAGPGEVTIRTQNRYLDQAIQGYDEVKEGNYAVLIVSDTGMGIPAESREKIFEPFYTKKTMGRSGTGLGLAIVWGTVKDHNGYIDLRTEVGEGTAFTLYFPVTREEPAVLEQKESVERYRGNGESVLVVDDIAEQRDVASKLLTHLGYKVHMVSSGVEAVEYLKANKADILILDMIMPPGIDGLETYRRILEINPMQKAILVSGFSETGRVKEAMKLGARAYIKKPYIMEKIGLAIREELNRQ